MKVILMTMAVALVASVEGGSSGSYGAPAPSTYGAPVYQSQTFKHVYVHVAPDEPVDSQSRVVRVPGGDKHVNIIFVKAPSSSSSQQTEVILPEQDEQKTLVYVLLKKASSSSDVKIRGPGPTQPTKPDVYFIRYKDQQQQAPGAYGAPAPVRTPSSSYGAF